MISLILITFTTACSHDVKRTEFPSQYNSDEMIESIEASFFKARGKQSDLLAAKEFNHALEHYREARKEYSSQNIDLKKLTTEAGLSHALFKRSIELADRRKQNYEFILSARMKAIDKDARFYNRTYQKLKAIDEDLINDTNGLTEPLDSEDYSKFQSKYQDLKVESIKIQELGMIHDLIDQARERDAEEKTPELLKKTIRLTKVSENLIDKNSSNASKYDEAVLKAAYSAALLTDVLDAIDSREGQLAESVGLELVQKNRALGKKDSDIETLKDFLAYTKNRLNTSRTDLNLVTEKLEDASRKLKKNQRLQDIAKTFEKSEAEIYQRDSDVIIRLKKIPFAVGQHKIPEKGKKVLEKVITVTEKVDPTKIIVLGHTDITGSKEYNKKLAKKRAVNVARYINSKKVDSEIETQAVGYERPLVANTDRESRALNRRVDIILAVN